MQTRPMPRSSPSSVRQLPPQRLGVLPTVGFWRIPGVVTSPFATSLAALAVAGVSVSSVAAACLAYVLSGELRWPPPQFYVVGLVLALVFVAGFVERTVRAAICERSPTHTNT